jgi:hypothetical protein
MLHAYIERFDVIGERENILGWDGKLTRPHLSISARARRR